MNPLSSLAVRQAVVATTVLLATSVVAVAQTAPSPVPATTKKDEPVQLAAFEVVMTQDKGYHSPYSGSALRTNEEIMKVPQSITVLTRDLIDDIASVDLSDMLNYVGIGNFLQGDSAYVRGNNAPINTDGAGDFTFDGTRFCDHRLGDGRARADRYAQTQQERRPPHKNTVATPDGLPRLGAGRDESWRSTR